MKDIQNQPDFRRINIKKVGVKNISYPITVLDKEKKTQKTVATFNMYVNLPHQFKGTHMSRFIEILNRIHGEINLKNFHLILTEMKTRLQAEAAHVEIEFPYFLKKTNSKVSGTVEYQCKMHGSLRDTDDLVLNVQVPIYPPSAVQQEKGGLPKSLGHWGVATVNVRFRHFIWIEDLIRMVESVTCHDLFWPGQTADLSRNNLEVETLCDALGVKFKSSNDIKWFSLEVKNFSEGCNTFASMEWAQNQAEAHPSLV